MNNVISIMPRIEAREIAELEENSGDWYENMLEAIAGDEADIARLESEIAVWDRIIEDMENENPLELV